jgi:Flp pilus assembly pilin Flp
MAVETHRGYRRGRIFGDQAGATAVEYAIMVGGIAVVIILAVVFLGNQLNSDFECAGSAVEAMPDTASCAP